MNRREFNKAVSIGIMVVPIGAALLSAKQEDVTKKVYREIYFKQSPDDVIDILRDGSKKRVKELRAYEHVTFLCGEERPHPDYDPEQDLWVNDFASPEYAEIIEIYAYSSRT